MSSPLAIAGVTAVLKSLLANRLHDVDLSPVGTFTVTASPPDRITTGDTEPNRLNWFLYQVTPNQGWRNEGMPSQSAQGGRLSNPPLALDLHYLLTAYGHVDLNAEILLGWAMEIVHEMPVLTRATIKHTLAPGQAPPVSAIVKDKQGRNAIDLADQIELIKIVPHYLSGDELAKLWTAMQSRYRPTVAYQVTTVLIQGLRPVRSSLPVLKRGEDDRGNDSQPDVSPPLPSWPTLLDMEIVPADGVAPRSIVELGDTLVLSGALLDADTVTAEFRHRLLDVPREVLRDGTSTAQRAVIVLPEAHDGVTSTDWPAGAYTVCLRLESAHKPVRRTNELTLNLAPRMKRPAVVAGGGGALTLTLAFAPHLWPAQRVEVFVGSDTFPPPDHVAKVATLAVDIKGVTPSEVPVPVRLRVDGVETLLVRDKTLRPPQFDPKQSITLPA